MAREARELERGETAREAALKLRYAADGAEFREALAVLKALLPGDSVAREGLLAWVRSSMIEEGAKEADMAELRQLEDLEGPVVETWWAKERREMLRQGLEEGRRKGRREAEARARQNQHATLARLARRKFGAETAKELALLLDGVRDSGRLDEVADLIIDCATGRELLAHVAAKHTTKE